MKTLTRSERFRYRAMVVGNAALMAALALWACAPALYLAWFTGVQGLSLVAVLVNGALAVVGVFTISTWTSRKLDAYWERKILGKRPSGVDRIVPLATGPGVSVGLYRLCPTCSQEAVVTGGPLLNVCVNCQAITDLQEWQRTGRHDGAETHYRAPGPEPRQ